MAARDKDQVRRFEEMAREVGADASGEEFERAFGKLVPPKPHPADKPKANPKRRRK